MRSRWVGAVGSGGRRAAVVGLVLLACAARRPRPEPAIDPNPPEVVPPEPEVRLERGRTIDRHEVHEVRPPGARGVVLLFHGLGGRAGAWRDRPDMRAVAEALEEAGWATIAIGADPERGQAWDVSGPDSPDLRVVRLALADAGVRGPVHAVGHSYGGAMAMLTAAALPVASVVVVHGAGAPGVGATSPTLFVASVNDSVVSPDRVRRSYETLARSGVEVGWREVGPVPLTAEDLERAAGVAPEVAAAALGAAARAGLVDGSGVPVVHPLLARRRWEEVLGPVLGTLPPRAAADLRDRLLVAYAEHPLPASVVPDVIGWLEAHPGR